MIKSNNDGKLPREYRFLKTLFILVFVLYSIFFVFFVAILVAPAYSGLLYIVLGLIWHFYFFLLIPLLLLVGLVLGYIIRNRFFARKHLGKLVLVLMLIIVMFIVVYFLLDWLIPIFSNFYSN